MGILARYLPDLIDIVHAGTVTGPYGDADLDWTNATVTAGVPAKVNPLTELEKFDEARDVFIDALQVLTNQEGITGLDRIVWPSGTGQTYEIMGSPAEFRNPVKSNQFDHAELTIREVRG